MLALSYATLNRWDSPAALAMLQALAARAEEVRGRGRATHCGGTALLLGELGRRSKYWAAQQRCSVRLRRSGGGGAHSQRPCAYSVGCRFQ